VICEHKTSPPIAGTLDQRPAPRKVRGRDVEETKDAHLCVRMFPGPGKYEASGPLLVMQRLKNVTNELARIARHLIDSDSLVCYI